VLVALPWVGWALLRLVGVEVPYPLVAVIAFTPYAALTSPVPVAVALWLRRWKTAAVAALAAVALVVAVVPRARADDQPTPDGPRLVVMTSNQWLGHADTAATLRIARQHDVDIISLQELRPRPSRKYAFEADRYPHQILLPDTGAAGSGLLSKYPLEQTGGDADLQPEAIVTVPGAPPVRIKAVHPRPPVNRAAEPEWREALAALPGSDSRGDVRILAGDFNATLDHPELRKLLARGYTDAADAVGSGLSPTWGVRSRRGLPITIDHILVDTRVRIEKVTVERIPRTDHRAVIAVLRLPDH
jgi:endonuclease/exonuclease/phosphatase (EEP) superfamily protein YafD